MPVFRLAKEIQQVSSSKDLAAFRRLLAEHRCLLHQNHYLLMLLKRHIVILIAAGALADLTLAELREVKNMCEEVS